MHLLHDNVALIWHSLCLWHLSQLKNAVASNAFLYSDPRTTLFTCRNSYTSFLSLFSKHVIQLIILFKLQTGEDKKVSASTLDHRRATNGG